MPTLLALLAESNFRNAFMRARSTAILGRLPVVLLSASLAGCAVYRPQDIDSVASQVQFDSRSLGDAGVMRFIAANGGSAEGPWDLRRLTLAAFYFNPQLDRARAELAVAEAGVRTAGALPNPSFDFTPGYNQDAAAGSSPWALGYALGLTLELAGKREHRTSEARHRAELARLDLAAQAWAAHSTVRRALVEVQGAEAEAELWRAQLPLAAQAARLLEAQVQAGDGSPFEAAQARSALSRATLASSASERAAANARSRLAEAVGVPLAALVGVRLAPGEPPDAAPPARAEARAWAARNRADLLAALAAYAAAQSALQGEIARQYPDLRLGPGYQLDQGEGKWSLGLGVTLPVFHRNQGPIAAAEARRAAAAAQFLAVQGRVLAEVDRAAADYSSTLADLGTVRTLRAALERQAALVRARHAAGDTSRLDLARAEVELADQARIELAARKRAELARGAFEDAVQRPLAWPEAVWRESPHRTDAK